MFAGLKGAVPILLGSFILSEHIADAERLYGIVVIVVVLSVVVPGQPGADRGSPPAGADARGRAGAVVARRTAPATSPTASTGSRSRADRRPTASRISDLTVLPEGVWVSFVVRRGQLVPVSAETVLEAADEALVLGDPSVGSELRAVFEGSRPRSSPASTRSISRSAPSSGRMGPVGGEYSFAAVSSSRSGHSTSAQTRNRRSRRCGGRDLRTEDSRTRRTSRAHELVRRPAAWMYPH